MFSSVTRACNRSVGSLQPSSSASSILTYSAGGTSLLPTKVSSVCILFAVHGSEATGLSISVALPSATISSNSEIFFRLAFNLFMQKSQIIITKMQITAK